MLVHTPKFINQDLANLKSKIDLLPHEVGLSYVLIENFLAYLCII